MHLKKRGNIYWLRYRIDGQDSGESLHTTSRREAEKILAVKKSEYVTGKFQIKPKAVSLKDFASQYIELVRQHNKDVKHKETHLRWFIERFRGYNLHEITAAMVTKAQQDLIKTSFYELNYYDLRVRKKFSGSKPHI